MKKFDTVLFDFDGTIMNTNEVILRSWQHTFQTIEHRDEDGEDHKDIWGTAGSDNEKILPGCAGR